MDHASTDLSTSGRDARVRRQRRSGRLRLRHRRRRSPTPTSAGPTTSPERTPSFSEASVSAPPSYLPSPVFATSSYVAVAPLPIFRGDPGECPDAHLARFDRVCRANNAASAADAARIFPASLDADAALWYEFTACGASSPPPWHAVRAAFVDFFRPPGAADRARADLMSLRQRPGEAVNRYHLRMQGILRRFPDGGADVPDAFLKSAFVDGLCAEFQDWVAPQHPEALDEAVALSLSWERAESRREARRAAKEAAGNASGRCDFCGAEGHEETRCEVRRSSSSVRGSAAAGKVGEEAKEGGGSTRLGRLGSAVSTRSVKCQCRKHQCWKKAATASEVAAGGEANGAPAGVAAGNSRRRSVSREPSSRGRARLHGRAAGRLAGADGSSTRRFGRMDSGLSLGPRMTRRGSERAGRGGAARPRRSLSSNDGAATIRSRIRPNRELIERCLRRAEEESLPRRQGKDGSSGSVSMGWSSRRPWGMLNRIDSGCTYSRSSTGAASSCACTSPTAPSTSGASASSSSLSVSRRGNVRSKYTFEASSTSRRRRRQERQERREERLRRLKNKLALVFHHRHDHHHHHHIACGRPGSKDGLSGRDCRANHGRSPWKYLGGMFHRTTGHDVDKKTTARTVVTVPAKRRGGGGGRHVHSLFDALMRHKWGVRKAPAGAAMRRTSSRVQVKKMHWWQRLRRRRGRREVAGSCRPRRP